MAVVAVGGGRGGVRLRPQRRSRRFGPCALRDEYSIVVRAGDWLTVEPRRGCGACACATCVSGGGW